MARRSKNSAVVTHTYDPGTDWSLPEARGLIENGYSADQVHKMTGWPVAMLLARQPVASAK